MSDRPSLYLAGWASYQSPGHHGPGRKYTIMAQPRPWEQGQGNVPLLVPGLAERSLLRALVEARQRGDAPPPAELAAYRQRMDARWQDNPLALRPGSLWARVFQGNVDVEPGDTLCCACSRAESAAGRCHRAWAAPFLAAAGWQVVLDGRPLGEPAA